MGQETLEGLDIAQIKTLYKIAHEGTKNLTYKEAKEKILNSNPQVLAQAEYFLLLIYEAKKSGFEYASKHF